MVLSGKLSIEEVESYVGDVFGSSMHQRRQGSLADAAFGLLNSESLRIHSLGEGLARGKGLQKKHATKQVDRMLSNEKLCIWGISAQWVPYVIGERAEIMVAIDWTSFANDTQQCVCINLLTRHGRATPLLWKSMHQHQIRYNRAHYEDQLLSRLKETLPAGVKVTVIADRGFASAGLFSFIEHELGFDYIIRIQQSTTVTNSKGLCKKVRDWQRKDGRALSIKDAKLTKKQCPVAQVVLVKDKAMKAGWFLVTNSAELKTREIINLYAKRWKIEPYFRDIKDQRFGFGLKQTHISSPERRDRLLLIVALAYVLLTLLGAAGELIGFDRKLKVNTVKTRTHSLIRQGMFYYDFFHRFSPDEQHKLLAQFNQLLQQHAFWKQLFCLI